METRSSAVKTGEHRDRPRHMYRKTLWLIFGHLIAAFVLAVGHFIFFSALDNSLVDKVKLSQSWVTAFSLSFVTLARGALTFCVGTCFVQHLWGVFQEQYTSLKDIERLFSLRGNLLAILDPRAIWKASVLFFMGAYLWLLPVALIYPPGALTVSMNSYYSVKSFNMSVLNQSFPDDFDPLARRSRFSSLSKDGPIDGLVEPEIQVLNSSTAQISYSNDSVNGMLLSYTNYAKFLLSAGQISRIGHPPCIRNSSYTLEFEGPQLHCTESDINTTRYALFDSGGITPYITKLHDGSLRSYDIWNFLAEGPGYGWGAFDISLARFLGYISQRNADQLVYVNSSAGQFGIATQLRTLSCEVYAAIFKVNITSRDGSQTITYTTHRSRVLNNPGTTFMWSDENHSLDPKNKNRDYIRSIVPRQSTRYKKWARYEAPSYLRNVNALCMYMYALETIMGYLGTWLEINTTQGVQCIKDGWFEGNATHGKRVELCPLYTGTPGMGETEVSLREDMLLVGDQRSFSDYSEIPNSAFNMRRFNGHDDRDNIYPVNDLNITAASLNELFANISISMVTQNTFFNNVTVNVGDFRNVYHFIDKPGFCIPYALSIAIAAVYALIAVQALRKNGRPAADGGFLQIMMTTRGNTEMERLVVEQGPRSVDDVKGELATLKVRLGEIEFETQNGSGEGEEGKNIVKRLAFRTESEYETARS